MAVQFDSLEGNQAGASVETNCETDLISAVVAPHGQAVTVRRGGQDERLSRSGTYVGNVLLKFLSYCRLQSGPLLVKVSPKLNAAAQQLIHVVHEGCRACPQLALFKDAHQSAAVSVVPNEFRLFLSHAPELTARQGCPTSLVVGRPKRDAAPGAIGTVSPSQN